MDCGSMLELLSASLDGELTPAEEALLRAHLDACPACRALREELAGVRGACGGPEVLPPAQLKARILANLPPQRAAKAHPWRRWGALAAALVIVAMAAWRLPHVFFQAPDQASAETVQDSRDAAAPLAREASPDGDGALTESKMAQMAEGREKNAYVETAPQAPMSRSQPAPAAGDSTALQDREAEDPPFHVQEAAPAAGETGDAENAREAETEDTYQDLALAAEGANAEDAPAPYALPSHAPETADAPLTAIALNPTRSVPVDFTQYRAVITLTDGAFEGDALLCQVQENGDTWYLLPASALDDLSQIMGDAAYELRQEGEDLTRDGAYVLLVVPAAP